MYLSTHAHAHTHTVSFYIHTHMHTPHTHRLILGIVDDILVNTELVVLQEKIQILLVPDRSQTYYRLSV